MFQTHQAQQAEALAELGYCNPFLPERIHLEQKVLGADFNEPGLAWHKLGLEGATRPNIARLTDAAQALADTGRAALLKGNHPADSELALYEDVVLYYVYNRYEKAFRDYLIKGMEQGRSPGHVAWYAGFEADLGHYLGIQGFTFASLAEAPHLFACFFQLRRAFHHIFENIIGGSLASAHLRAFVWQSVFTCDMRRYRRALFDRMGDVPTLVTGPSGTGKELVARSIGLSRYIGFDGERREFTADFTRGFLPVNLAALSPTLIESELFGHIKGAFTGAVQDRHGYFEMCPAHGTVFLDELGELDPALQVKLLRVLQTRRFQAIGDTEEREFKGKIVAATNRDLAAAMANGTFREDFYYRLNADIVRTPSLREQIAEAPEQRHNLVHFIARRVAGDAEADALTDQVESWIDEHLGSDYPWPGNVRELEQCVRNIMVRQVYLPAETRTGGEDPYLTAVAAGRLTADELLNGYTARIYGETGSYQETARRLGLDRRTVKAKVDAAGA